MNNNKRGQFTIFVILGLVFIIGISLYFYLTEKQVTSEIDVPRLAGPAGQVQIFVEGCIDQVGRMGLTELGRHGGYIDPLDRSYALKTFDYNIIDQSESDMVFLNRLDKNSGIPYWYYFRSSNDCWHCDALTLSPSIPLMEYQLGRYVDNNIQGCLDNYNAFTEQGFEIVSVTNTTTIATIKDDSVEFLTKYTLQLTKDDVIEYITVFYKDIDIPLLKYHQIAVKMTQNEMDTEYLDFYGLYLLGQYMGMDTKKLPPFSAYRAGYSPILWSKTNVRILYESLLTSYTPFFRVANSGNEINYTFTGQPLELQMYRAMRLPIFSEEEMQTLDIKNKEINHIYAGQQIYMNVRPNNGEVISPFVTSPASGLGGVISSVEPDQSYEFFYDISYPIIIEIKDSRAGKDYSFMFALQGNIKENKFVSEWIAGLGTIPWSDEYLDLNSDIPIGTEIEDLETGENYTYETPQGSKTLFCDKNQRLSGNIRLRTYDANLNSPLDDVSVTYYCGSYADCFVGKTLYNSILDEASFNGKLPICANGYLQLDKEGYLSKKIPLTTEYEISNYVNSVYMEKIFTKNVTVQKYPVSRINGYSLGLLTNLSANDTVTLSLRKITLDEWDEPWIQTIILGKDSSQDATLQLVSGIYVVDAQLLDYNGVVIPKECQKIKVKGDEDIFIPSSDIKIDVAMWGGIQFNESNPFIITTDDLVNTANNGIGFYVVRMPNPRCLNDMGEPSLIGNMAKRYSVQLTPKFT